MTYSLREIEEKMLDLRLEAWCRKAYEQGVEDGRKQSYKELLKISDLEEMFQIANSTVNKIIARPDFPRSTQLQARFPRRQVLKWVEQNSTWVEQNTNYYSKEAM
ncbi:hypothetical protein ABFV99_23895 [Cytobacillus horneckiae]|uniref:helix-turn-helix transcriptional regulator n=1 Tax=Cytobacillus horneckiae TaxID=549687 RepID=UPI0034CD191B